jgi:acyl-coenzyme A synthetase/AMP-(fatty) acid ligase
MERSILKFEQEELLVGTLIDSRLASMDFGFIYLDEPKASLIVLASLIVNRSRFCPVDEGRARMLGALGYEVIAASSIVKTTAVGYQVRPCGLVGAERENKLFGSGDLRICTSGSDSDGLIAFAFTWDQVLSHSEVVASTLSVDDWDVLICPLPFSYVYGLSSLLVALLAGKTVACIGGGGVLEISAQAPSDGRSFVPLVPSMVRPFLNKTPSILPKLFERVSIISFAGGAISVDEATAFDMSLQGSLAHLFIMYGCTEGFGRVSCYDIKAAPEWRSNQTRKHLSGVVGRVIEGVTLDCGLDGIAKSMTSPYLSRIKLDLSQFPPSVESVPATIPVIDQMRLDADAYLRFVSRGTGTLKIDDKRFSPELIAKQCRSIVGSCADIEVFAIDADKVLVVLAGSDRMATEVASELASKLSVSKRSLMVQSFSELPLSSNGKVDRRRIREILRH